mmetsp:Transcript_36562/g.35370  ORF Transcript_36562/g.35370 Transcript_36562/m.35370 type:complete len:81 (-) Transcript_36562:5-247(-)
MQTAIGVFIAFEYADISSWFSFVEFVLTLIMGLFVIIVPFLSFIFIRKNALRINDETFKTQFESLYDGLKIESALDYWIY